MADETPQHKGGRARAAKLTKAERSEIASVAAKARWDAEKKLPLATHGSPDQPLTIGDAELECYVLENGARVISQRGMYRGMGFSRGGARRDEEAQIVGAELPRFAAQNWIKPFVDSKLSLALSEPIHFRLPGGGRGYGYPATVIADFCDAVLEARLSGATGPRQAGIVQRCEMLVRGFARVGIIALVDEATGYQQERDRAELHRILAAYLSEERLAWAKRFPDEFYKQIYRLKGWKWPATGRAKPPVLGHITNDIVYDRLPTGVLAALRDRNPVDEETKRRKWRNHQFLSQDFGQPDLRDHLLQVIAIARVSRTWDAFRRNIDNAFPKPGSQGALDLGED